MSDILTANKSPSIDLLEINSYPTENSTIKVNSNEIDQSQAVDKLLNEPEERKLTVLYGSQTGTAQDVAERIWRQSRKYGFSGNVLSMDEYPVVNFTYEKLVIFVCSTTGQGDEPDNMKAFWKILLRKSLPTNSLAHIKYAVIGLGDSSYTNFNFVAKRLFKRISQLGGEALAPVALADDQHDLGIDATIEPFLNNLWEKILNLYPIPKDFQPLSDDQFIYRWNVEEVNQRTQPVKLKSIYDAENDKSFKVSIKANERLTSVCHFQDVRLIKFRAHEDQTFNPGDIVQIRPKNLEQSVTEFFNLLLTNKSKLTRKTRVKLTSIYDQMPVPKILRRIWTLENIVRDYWDLSAIPRRYVFELLATVTSSQLEKEKCLEFTSAEGQEELYNYCNRPRRTILEVLCDFPHAAANLNLKILFEIMQPIRQREFSIASSSLAYSNEIHILVAVVKYKTVLVRERLGLCSNWLASLINGDEFRISIKSGTFKFPSHQDYEFHNYPPVIMIGPGTGVAPFRGYIMDRIAQGNATKEKLILFFGCRYKKHDFLCKEEFDKLVEQSKLTLVCAFSRDQENKVYVQHKIIDNKSLIGDLILYNNAHIYVAGNSKNMPQDVRNAFVECIQTKKGYTPLDADEYIKRMEKNGRYQTETWS